MPFGKISLPFLSHSSPKSRSLIPVGDAFNFLLDVIGYPDTLTMFVATIGLLILRRRAPNLRRPFKVWLPLALFFLAVQVFLMITPFIRPENGKGDTSLPYWLPPVTPMVVLAGGVIYWVISYVAWPSISFPGLWRKPI